MERTCADEINSWECMFVSSGELTRRLNYLHELVNSGIDCKVEEYVALMMEVYLIERHLKHRGFVKEKQLTAMFDHARLRNPRNRYIQVDEEV